jgi:uncharacterized protein (DUF1499 family)
MSDATAQPNWFARNVGRIGAVGLTLAVVGALVAMVSGPAYQLGVLKLFPAFQTMFGGAIASAVGGVICLIAVIIAIVRYKGDFATHAAGALLGVIIGAVVFYVPYSLRAAGAPPIHEVSTDIDNPPPFVDVVALRAESKAANPPEYVRELKRPGGSGPAIDVPAMQKQHYPDLVPVVLPNTPPAQAFEQALAAAKKQPWTIVAAVPEEGRIEAWHKTPWFGFVDDVVIRVAPEGEGSKIDVRSKSRIGFGDVGMNAKRVRAYFKALNPQKTHG